MKTILVGNGIDIQFGGYDYLNSSIIRRAIDNVECKRFNPLDYPPDILSYINELFEYARMILIDPKCIENKVWDKWDKEILKNFLIRYTPHTLTSVEDLGFEDYFFIQKLMFNATYDPKIGNWKERQEYYEYLRRFFLDAIYNDGKLLEIEYPSKLSSFFKQFDKIFSLNYDKNIEKITDCPVYYLHGAFHILNEKYNNDSPMNILMNIHTDLKGREHLYSTALTTYCGEEKEKLLIQADQINTFFKSATALKEKCIKSGTKMHSQLARIIDAYEKCPGYTYPQNYCYDKFENIKGSLTILGLSPMNDEHILKIINSKIDHIRYYYYSLGNYEKECTIIKEIFPEKEIEFVDVVSFWDSFQE